MQLALNLSYSGTGISVCCNAIPCAPSVAATVIASSRRLGPETNQPLG